MSLFKRCKHTKEQQGRCDDVYWSKFMRDGKLQPPFSTGTSDRRIAQEIEDAAIDRYNKKKRGLIRTDVADHAITLGELATEYGEYYAATYPATAKNYGLRVIRRVTAALGADTSIDQITAWQLLKWRNQQQGKAHARSDKRRGRPLKASTLNVHFGVVGGMFAWAVEHRRTTGLDVNPIASYAQLADDEKPVRHATAAELALLKTAPADIRLICELTVTSLGRLREIALLRPKDLIGLTNEIATRRKGGFAERLPVTPDQMRDLQALVVDVRQPYVFFPDGFANDDEIKTALAVLSARISNWWTSAGVPDLHHHVMRHTGITLMGNKAIDPRVIQTLAGWKGLDQLQRYGHVGDAEIARAVAATSGALTAEPTPPAAEPEAAPLRAVQGGKR
jgi:site-specific recombinase XerC